MRERFADVFDRIYIDNGNGDKYRTGKVTPDGKPDPSVFSTAYNREGIQVGVAVSTLVRQAPHTPNGAEILYREFWGKDKLARIAGAGQGDGAGEPPYQRITPPASLGLPFSPATVAAAYLAWPKLPELFPAFFPGVQTKRDEVVVDIDRARLEARMKTYFDPTVSDAQAAKLVPGSMDSTAQYNPVTTRAYLVKRGYLPEYLVRFCYRPFDMRWLYWEPETGLLGRKTPEYFPHVFEGNLSLVSQHVTRREWSCPQVVQNLGCLDLMDRGASVFPLKLKATAAPLTLFPNAGADTHPPGAEPTPSDDTVTRWNLSETALAYLQTLGGDAPGPDTDPDTLFFHALAVLHSPRYRAENSGALRQDWPRIPLPPSRHALETSATLGRTVAALLDTLAPVPGVTIAPIRADLRGIAPLTRTDGQPLKEEDWAITAGWGNPTRTGIMPGRGKMTQHADGTLDIYLNDTTAWRGIPPEVWRFTLGGYQVMKKWLSYRDLKVLGRPLTGDEAREVQQMARRIAALLALGAELDANYAAVAEG